MNHITIKDNLQKAQGFSLIELLIVVALIGILTTIAYPSYQYYLLKSHRVDALTALMQDQIILERCYAQNFSYSEACNLLPEFPQYSTQGFYTITLSNRDTATYTLTATPIGAQTKDTTCASLSITQANEKKANNVAGTPQSTCWNLT